MIYDPDCNRLVVFGGRSLRGDLDDTWSFDLDSRRWRVLAKGKPGPTRRYTHNAVYDPTTRRMLVWSGRHAEGGLLFNDVWAFDLDNEIWTELSAPDPKPNIRYGTAAVLDPISRTLVSFGGFTDEGRFDDTWRFDVDGQVWHETGAAIRPSARCLHSASYDSRRHRMIIYGGQRNGPLGDIWAYDLTDNTWREMTPDTRPAGRTFPAHAYDPDNDRVIIFGGNRGAEGKSNGTWAFDLIGETWEEMDGENEPPAPRDGAAAVYIAAQGRLVLFGGSGTDGNFADVWALEGLSPTAAAVDTNDEFSPQRVVLHPNNPNPFNPETRIRYELSRSTAVDLDVYDLLGRRVRSLVQKRRIAGEHTVRWDATDDNGQPLASGVYFYRLRAGDEVRSQKMTLIR